MTQEENQRFQELFVQNIKRVTGLARRLTGNYHDAEDIAQKVFISLAARISDVAKYERPDLWLLKNTASKVMHYWRDKKKRPEEWPLEMAPDACAPELLGHMADELPGWVVGSDRDIFLLYYEDGYSLRDISAILGIAYGTCRVQLSRLREKLKKDKEIFSRL